jgi:hypothetical protein
MGEYAFLYSILQSCNLAMYMYMLLLLLLLLLLLPAGAQRIR